MLRRAILSLGAPGSQAPFDLMNLTPPEGEEWVHLPISALEKWIAPKDVEFHRVYVDMEALAPRGEADAWSFNAWKGALNALLVKLVHQDGKVPQLVGFSKETTWSYAVAAVKIGVRDLISFDELFADFSAHAPITKIELENANVIPFPGTQEPATYLSLPEVLKKFPKNAIPFPIEGLEGESAAIDFVRSTIRKSAPMNSSVLIVGPTGSGKERVADAIYRYSERSQKPFVVLDCAAINPNLFESELFGHVEGAFTNAIHARKGVFEMAHKGSLLIDQIHLLSLEQQAKLLRVLQDKRFSPVGGHESIEVDVRLIATSQVLLEEWVQVGKFREDLFFRIKVIDIYLPALSERRTDIPLLIESILKKLAKSQKRPTLQMSGPCLEKILLYDWPGNIRELKNCLERACTIAWSDVRPELRVSDLSESVQFAVMKKFKTQTLKEATKRFEQEYITQTLRKFGGSKDEAAEALGLSLATLYRKIGS